MQSLQGIVTFDEEQQYLLLYFVQNQKADRFIFARKKLRKGIFPH